MLTELLEEQKVVGGIVGTNGVAANALVAWSLPAKIMLVLLKVRQG